MALSECSPRRCAARWSLASSVMGMALSALAGCGGGPGRVEAPDWDPAGIAESIVEDLDKNGDGAIDAEELKGAPGLAAGVRFIDEDKDEKITSAEIEARFDKYASLRTGLRGQTFRITYKGRPVANAEVRFIPESFLTDIIGPAVGTTDENGVVIPIAEGQDLIGLRIGYYRVQIVSGGGSIPEAYRSETSPLGADVSLSEDAASYGTTELKITD